MRLCFYNPHLIDILGESLFAFFFSWGNPAKRNRRLGFMLQMLRQPECSMAILVDGTVSSMPFRRLGRLFDNPRFIRAFSFFEIYVWLIINRINPFKQTVIFSSDRLDPARDVLFGFAFLGKTFFDADLTRRSFFSKFTGRKLLHATHFYENTELVAENVRRAGVHVMVAEVDVLYSPYFKKYFDFIDKVILLPFGLRERYVSTTPFLSRKNKCVALGTLAFFPDGHEPTAAHRDFFGTNTLHPMRKEIFDRIPELSHALDSLIVTHKKKPQNRKRGVLEILWANINPATKEYHKFDIVGTYNAYRMFVSPEETIGQPSINAIEGMACGCAYVGTESPMYVDMGLVQGIHYVPYDGTAAGLARAVAEYQSRPEELARIAEAGRRFVVDYFRPERVIRTFVKTLKSL